MEAITFLGYRLPVQVTQFLKLLPKLPQALVQPLFQLAFQYTLGHEISEEKFEEVASQQQPEQQLERQALATVFTALHVMLRAAVRQRLRAETLQRDLQELKLPPYLVADFVKALKASALAERKLAEQQRVRLTTLEHFKWRCDVTVSSNQMGRVLKPTIVVELRTSDGRRRTFELSTERFQQLRLHVARALHEMHDLERLAILKIAPKA